MSTEARIIVSGGVQQEAKMKFHSSLPQQEVGKHLWVHVAMFGIADPSASHFDLDLENLLTIEGPCCYWCEEAYAQAASRCPGEPR